MADAKEKAAEEIIKEMRTSDKVSVDAWYLARLIHIEVERLLDALARVMQD